MIVVTSSIFSVYINAHNSTLYRILFKNYIVCRFQTLIFYLLKLSKLLLRKILLTA